MSKLYLAKDADGGLYLHDSEPEWNDFDNDFYSSDFMRMPFDVPEIKPGECYEVEIKLGDKIN